MDIKNKEPIVIIDDNEELGMISDSMKIIWLKKNQNHWHYHNSRKFIDPRIPQAHKGINEKKHQTFGLLLVANGILHMKAYAYKSLNILVWFFLSNFKIRYICYIRHLFSLLHYISLYAYPNRTTFINLIMCKIMIIFFFVSL